MSGVSITLHLIFLTGYFSELGTAGLGLDRLTSQGSGIILPPALQCWGYSHGEHNDLTFFVLT